MYDVHLGRTRRKNVLMNVLLTVKNVVNTLNFVFIEI